ncbi:protein disulfide-isomerase A6-like isoform X3 [Narcine bancroftii]|uniref:protein disulfide-isomerase A6-like isoform X3 n=1 Tax=Narcine bancroftii TaxID=1343680 RepID=UPI003831F0F5
MSVGAGGIFLLAWTFTVNAFYSSTNVIKLTSINFNSQVIQSDKLWLVEFYVHWCEHCEQFAPEWIKVASALKGIVKVGAIDVTKYVSIGHQYEIEEFPTIKFFGVNKNKPEKYYGGRSSAAIANGVLNSIRFTIRERLMEKSRMCASERQIQQVPMIKIFQANKEVVDYNGEKSTPSIIAAGLNLYSKISLYKPFEQMVNEEIFKTVCDLQVLCIIAVLPHISETGNSGRSDYLSLLMKIAHKYKKKKWGWLWTESGAQPKLENALGIDGLKFPNIISIDARRKKYMLLRGSFSERRISEFFRKLSLGHVSRIPISNDFSKVKTVKRWDSMGGELPKEDSILSGPSFQELENDEL